MVVPFGHTVAMSDRSHTKTAVIMGAAGAVILPLLLFFFGARELYIYIYNNLCVSTSPNDWIWC